MTSRPRNGDIMEIFVLSPENIYTRGGYLMRYVSVSEYICFTKVIGFFGPNKMFWVLTSSDLGRALCCTLHADSQLFPHLVEIFFLPSCSHNILQSRSQSSSTSHKSKLRAFIEKPLQHHLHHCCWCCCWRYWVAMLAIKPRKLLFSHFSGASIESALKYIVGNRTWEWIKCAASWCRTAQMLHSSLWSSCNIDR